MENDKRDINIFKMLCTYLWNLSKRKISSFNEIVQWVKIHSMKSQVLSGVHGKREKWLSGLSFSLDTCIHMPVLIHTHAHTYTYTHTCTHVHIHTHTYRHIHNALQTINKIRNVFKRIWKKARKGVWEVLRDERKKGNDVIILIL